MFLQSKDFGTNQNPLTSNKNKSFISKHTVKHMVFERFRSPQIPEMLESYMFYKARAASGARGGTEGRQAAAPGIALALINVGTYADFCVAGNR